MIMSKTRVLVVDDSAFMRKVISDIISNDNELELAGTARNGIDALEKIEILKPDVITLDVEMPKLNGLEALEQIMKHHPTPTIMLSSLTKAGAEITIQALAKGAVDFIAKPGGSISLNIREVENEIINKVKLASKVNLKHLVSFEIKEKPLSLPKKDILNNKNIEFPLILLGTSTGGPKALHNVFEKLPGHLNAAVLIVQHMPQGFTKSLANRLDNISGMRVKEAENNEKVVPGTAYLAPGNYHMLLDFNNKQPIISLNQESLVSGHRPSVDALFNSVAEKKLRNVIAVIMTGMGSDGKKGLLNLKKNACYSIAESERSCVVFGMPKSAIEAGCIDKIVPLHKIADEIFNALKLI